MGSEKGQTRKKHSLAELIETHPGIRLWKKQYAAQMQELFEMIFDCVEYACCYIETDRWKWLKTYFCEFNPEDVKDSIPILLDTKDINPLTLKKNAKFLTDKDAQELQIASEIQNATKLDKNERTEIKDINENEGIKYNGPPEYRTKFDVHYPKRSDGPKNDPNSTDTARNNFYFNSIELETISAHSKTVTLFMFVSLFIILMRFRVHKIKNVLFTIVTRFNYNASSIIRKICSSLSAK